MSGKMQDRTVKAFDPWLFGLVWEQLQERHRYLWYYRECSMKNQRQIVQVLVGLFWGATTGQWHLKQKARGIPFVSTLLWTFTHPSLLKMPFCFVAPSDTSKDATQLKMTNILPYPIEKTALPLCPCENAVLPPCPVKNTTLPPYSTENAALPLCLAGNGTLPSGPAENAALPPYPADNNAQLQCPAENVALTP